MSSTTQPVDFSDLYTDLQNRVRVQTSVTATETQAKRYINTALQDMHIGYGEKFPWCEREATLILQPSYTTGTISVTNGSTSVTGSSTAWTTQNNYGVANVRAGGKILINGDSEPYTVSAVGGATSLTLSSRYIGSTVSGGTYVYYEDEYDLAADFLRPLSVQYFDAAREIELIGRKEFRQRYSRNSSLGKPMVACIVDREMSGNTTPRRRVVFWKPPQTVERVVYPYVTAYLAVSSSGTAQTSLSANSDEPIVPLRYRHAIVLHALSSWYRDKKDDQRSAEVWSQYTDLMLRMTSDTEFGQNRPQIRPRISTYVSGAKRPYRGGTVSRFVAGTRFDEMR